jgi:predicted nuclease of restriction endonuclease-like RecB superfamily
VRFSLQDVKKQVRRREGELTVTLHFLRPGELRAEIERLITYHEQHCGQTRGSFATDEASALVGDYRLAHCLLITLSAWYIWRQPAWEAALQELSEETRTALAEATIDSSVTLRLALFDYVNLHHHGFLDAQTRAATLETFATLYQLDVSRLDYLLALDTEDEAVLTRVASTPESDAVAGLYNQWVFEAALFSASEVRFEIDCEAFLDAQRGESGGALMGIGAVIKRLCYLARRLGVYYDLAYEEGLPGARTTLLHLTLYGPQEMTGSAQQYGSRLARLCRLLLDYGLAATPVTSGRRKQSISLNRAIRRAEATVHLFAKAYRFVMDAELLALLPIAEPAISAGRVSESATIYDSSIEQSFAEAFASLERGQGTAGWLLEREPEPLLYATGSDTSARGIFIPDFALTRGSRRIYIEILGFWTPAYRERKRQKLQQLKGRTDLVLAIPLEARPVFASLAADYPLIAYHNQLSASELLKLVQERYDDFEERLAQLDRVAVQERLRGAGFISERACYELLHCYRRSELTRAVAHVLVPDEMGFTPGFGLYMLTELEHLHSSFVEWIGRKDKAEEALAIILKECRVNWPELADCEDAAIETLLGLWPEVSIQRTSIFEATLTVEALRGERDAEREPSTSTETASAGTRKAVRERRINTKKRVLPETSQQDLWE